MKYEVEQKFYIDNLDVVERSIRKLGANIQDIVLQSDIYLSHPCRDFGITDEALRLRDDGERHFITYKGPRIDPVTKTRREIELMVPGDGLNWEKLLELLAVLGFATVIEVRKKRRKAEILWQNTNVEVVLDDVEHLGLFIELEINSIEANVDLAKSQIASLAEHIGLRRSERKSYCEMRLGQINAT